MMNRFILIAISASSLLACTSATVKNEVKANNWFSIGEYDASHGYIEKSKNDLQKMSQKISHSSADYGAYLAGYEQSLDIYCEPKNAYILGVKGLPYHNVCDRYPRGWAFYQDWISGRKISSGVDVLVSAIL